jgi:MFS family permease
MATIEVEAPRRLPFGLTLPDSLSALRERDFRVVWTGQAISMTGTWMQAIAQGLLVLRLWDSAFGLGLVNFANTLPSLVVILFGGVLADRADKRRILLVTQVTMMLLAAALAVLIVAGRIEFWVIVAATVMLGVAFGYDMPAYQSFLPELVPPEKIGQVVALNSSTFHGSRMVGPAIAGLTISALGLATAYFLNAASFLAVIFGLLIVRYRPRPRADGEPAVSAVEGLRQGLRHARGRPHVIALLMLTALNTTLVFPIIAVLTTFYVKGVLHAGDWVVGMVWASSGLGSVLGALALVWWGDHARAARIWLAVLVAPIGLVAMALTREPAIAIIIQAFLSFSFSSQLGLVQMMLQESTPPRFRGRVMSLNGIAFNGTTPFAALAASGLAAVVGLPAVMMGVAAVFGISAVLLLRFAGGGIASVVEQARQEYRDLALEPVSSH